MAGSRVGLVIYLAFFTEIFTWYFFPGSMTAMFPSLPPPEQVVPMDGVLSEHHMVVHAMYTTLVAVLRCCLSGPRTASADCCVGRETAPDKLTTCFVFAVMSDHL